MIKFLGAVLLLIFAYSAVAVDNWVICRNPNSGVEQAFKDSCPSGWVFVRPA